MGTDNIAYLKYAHQVEKNAKNQAYMFIIQMGLMKEFHDFCMADRTTDKHEGCLQALANTHEVQGSNTEYCDRASEASEGSSSNDEAQSK